MQQQSTELPDAFCETGGKPKKSPLDYLKRLKRIVTHQAEMNMNSEKAWTNFLAKRQTELTRDDLRHRYFRFNVEFPDRVPKLDRVDDLPLLQTLAEKFCDRNSRLINLAATKMTASLFYLKVGKIFMKANRAKFQVQGLRKDTDTISTSADETRVNSLPPGATF
jgi:hypothetical protein